MWEAKDIGGSMTIHIFGAYFGIAASYFFQNRKALQDNSSQTHNYYSNVFGMVGTLFLFSLWTSFNSALGVLASQQLRAIFNTVLAITSSCITACII